MDNNNLNTALDLIAGNEFEKASEVLEELYKNNSNNSEVLKNLGLCYTNTNKWDEAKNIFEKCIQLNHEDATSWFYLANASEKVNDIQCAINAYEKVIELRPEFYDAIKNLSVLYLTENSIDKAVSILERAIEKCNDDFQMYYLLGTAKINTGNIESGIDYLNKALELEPENIQILNNISSCYISINNLEIAQQFSEKAYDIDSENPITNFNLGLIFDKKMEYKRALNYYSVAYTKQATLPVLNAYANCSVKAKDYYLAKNLYSILVSLNPQQLKYQQNLMVALTETRDYKNALIIAKKLLASKPNDEQMLRKLAELHRLNGEYNEAIDILNIFVKKGKIETDIYWELGTNYINLDEKELAQTAFRKGLKLDSENPYLKRDLALLYLRLNQLDWAQDEMEEALKLKPEDSNLNFSMGVVYFELGEFELAQNFLEKVTNGIDKNEIYYSYVGQNLLKLRRQEEAIKAFKEALKQNPRDEIALYELAKYYYSIHDYSLAQIFNQELLFIKKDAEYEYLAGKIYIAKKEFKKAEEVLKKLAQNYPNNHIIQIDFAKVLYELNKIEESKTYLKKALEIYPDFDEAIKLLKKLEKNND